MFCSTVIPTIGRPELARAVRSVLEQNLTIDDFEVIVVNDSGRPLPEADWQYSERVRVLNTNQRERSVARNAGSAIAKGKYLHFLDDDDWLLPDALEKFWTLAQTRDADWLYGSSQLVDRQGKSLIQLHHGMNGNCFIQMMAGEWLPLQSSLIDSRKFFDVGGFNPFIPGAEDIDLSRRIALHVNFAGMPEMVACIGMGIENSSTNYVRALHDARWARERILDEPGAFVQMRASANSSDWYGRIVRVYSTSAVWNLQRKNVFTTASRIIFSLTGLILAGYHTLSKDFWQSVLKPYESKTFLGGFQESNRPVERRNVTKLT